MTPFWRRHPTDLVGTRPHPDGAQPYAVHLYEAGIARFWTWWTHAGYAVADAVAQSAPGLDGEAGVARALLDPAIGQIDPGLAWHVGRGAGSRFVLVVSGARHPALRVVAERWRRAGPPDDALWQFHPARPAQPSSFDAPVQVAGIVLEPAEALALVQLDDARFRMDVSVFHPAFAQLEQGAQTQVANVLVGWALGEDDTDRWIGQVDTTTTRPLNAVPVSLLGGLLGQLVARWGEERWATVEGVFGRSRLVATVRHPLHRVDHPLFDEHLAVRLPYRTTEPDGQPGPAAEAALTAARRALVDQLGANAILVATQTADGERLLHFYADSTASPLEDVRGVLTAHTLLTAPESDEAGVQVTYDPGWDAVDHLRTPQG
jgi:hypothetical protein